MVNTEILKLLKEMPPPSKRTFWTEEEKMLILLEYAEVDEKCFNGLITKFGVKIQFEPSVESKNGTYYSADKKIILNANGDITHRFFTLYHELIHAFDHSLGHHSHHDNWFWYTLGMLCAKRNIPFSVFMPQNVPAPIVDNCKQRFNQLKGE